jgi:ferric-dicitrate binding protein FerR (iron transport regulator)
MTPPPSSVTEFLRRLFAGLPATHRSNAMSVAMRVLVVGATVLFASGAQNCGKVSCRAAVAESGDLDLVEGGISMIPGSNVSVTRTANRVLVHVLEGEVLFRQRATVAEAVMVTAGAVQLRNISAVICVNVHKERTVVSVLDGAAELRAQEPQQQEAQQEPGGITLRPGDRVELRRVGRQLLFRLTYVEADSVHCAM